MFILYDHPLSTSWTAYFSSSQTCGSKGSKIEVAIAAQSSAEQVRSFTEGTRVYGDYFVIIEQYTLDSHNYSKSPFFANTTARIRA